MHKNFRKHDAHRRTLSLRLQGFVAVTNIRPVYMMINKAVGALASYKGDVQAPLYSNECPVDLAATDLHLQTALINVLH